MTTFIRKMWRNHSKHKKLSEEWALAECEGDGWWGEAREARGGVRYAGAAPVDRAASAPATVRAVRAALQNAKNAHRKLRKVEVDISARGVVATDAATQTRVLTLSIYRISYCSADAANARVFAVVEGAAGAAGAAGAGAGAAGGGEERHVAHVFVCSRRRVARALALSLAHAFNDAYQAWQASQPSSISGAVKRVDPWMNFHDEEEEVSEEEVTSEWPGAAPLVSFA